jgi:hypothetical protein
MATSMKEKRGGLEIVLVLAVFLVVNFASQVYQPHITYNNGQSFDGVFYYRVADQLANGLPVSTEGPFVYRIGTPFLVAVFFKGNLLSGFKAVNMLANLFSTGLLLLWLRLFLRDWRMRVLLVVLFLIAWHGPVRFTYYDPTFTDPWLFVFLLAGLILIQHLKAQMERQDRTSVIFLSAGLGILTFVGVIFREVVLAVPLCLFFVANPLPRITELVHPLASGWLRRPFKGGLALAIFPLLAGIAAMFLVHRIASQYNDYSFVQTALDWAYQKPALTYLHAYFITFGVLILIPLHFWRRSLKFLGEHQHLLIFLVIFLVLGWIGGSDTERFLFWAMPVVFLLIGVEINENLDLFRSPRLVLLLAGATACSMRLFWVVADYPNPFKTPFPILSILSNKFQYLDLWSFFADRTMQVRSLGEYLILSCLILVWLKRRAEENRMGRLESRSSGMDEPNSSVKKASVF